MIITSNKQTEPKNLSLTTDSKSQGFKKTLEF